MSSHPEIILAGPPSLAKGLILSARESKEGALLQKKTQNQGKIEMEKILASNSEEMQSNPLQEDSEKKDNVIFTVNKELPLHIEVLPLSKRPMIWNDIPEFASRHNRTIADIVYDLALLTSHAYAQKTKRRTIVPMDLELLVRLYDAYPSSCAWHRPDIRTTFEFLYGSKIAEFSPAYENVARLAIGRRYARMLGRVDTAQYRWLSVDGKVTRRLENIVSKIHGIADAGDDPLTTFEALSRRSWLLRGVDIDKVVPFPTAASVIKPAGTRGRRMTENKKSKLPTTDHYDGGVFGS